MAIPAYSPLYRSKAAYHLGNMVHDAVWLFGIPGTDILKWFIQSGIATEFEDGNPKYVVGKSGLELLLEIIEITTGERHNPESPLNFDRSPEYWAGWILAQYQWYSGRTFKNILDTIPYDELICLYGILHEADIQKCFDVLDAHFAKA